MINIITIIVCHNTIINTTMLLNVINIRHFYNMLNIVAYDNLSS